MGNSKFILACIFPAIIAISVPFEAKSQEMKSINDFVQGNLSSKNKSTEFFVGMRCYAIYSVFSFYLDDNAQTQMASNFKVLAGKAFDFALANREKSSDDYISSQAKMMVDGYVERFLKSKALTGNGTDDTVIENDLSTCGYIFGGAGK